MKKMEEILLLLAYLAIGLMSITVPTYAISVSYLARETSKTLEEMRERREELSENLDELRRKLKKEPGVEEIKKEIQRFEEEETELKGRLECLSVKGAVSYPFVGFVLGLLCAASGIYFFPESTSLLILPTILFVSYGLYRLAKSLLAIEQAALRPEEKLLPTFRVSFASKSSIERFKAKEQKIIGFRISNYGKDVAEDVNVMVFFPPEFKVLKKPGYTIVPQGPAYRHAYHNAAKFRKKILYVELAAPFTVKAIMPDEPGIYPLPVCVRARVIGKSDHELTIEVV
jgi:hypothetical protein